MTTEEKLTLARFLDLAGDYLRDGYALRREDSWHEEGAWHQERALTEPGAAPEDFSSLPLAYQVDEDEDPGARETLEDIAAAIGSCNACDLGASRTLPAPGEGVDNPLVMVIGEGPGADEDAAGRPFVGKAGQLLDRMLGSIGVFRDKNCYIANMVKCRPPGNRDPAPEEIAACFPYLEQQIKLLRPRVILCVGRVAAQSLLKTSKGIGELRGAFAKVQLDLAAKVHLDSEAEYRSGGNGNGETVEIPVLCTFHPSAVLRDESLKRPAWEDLKLLRSRLDSMNLDSRNPDSMDEE